MRKVIMPIVVVILLGLSFVLSSCSSSSSTVIPYTTEHEESTESGTDIKVTAVISQIDLDTKSVSFSEVGTEAEFIYPYDGGTTFYSKSDIAMAATQIEAGDIVDLYYDSGSHMIHKIQISTNEEVWTNSKVTSFKFDDTTHSMTIGKSLYSYSEKTLVVSDGEIISVMEINAMDQLVVNGYGNNIESIVVEKGHGYITLEGDQFFIGGLVNVDGILVKEIEENMMLIVTEGNHKVSVVNGDYESEKSITVVRNQEIKVDFSDVKAIVTETGSVKFIIDVDAILYIDNVEVDYSSIVNLDTGTHSIIIVSDDYDTYTDIIDVQSGYQTVTYSLGSDTDETTTDSTETTTVVEGETVVSSINDVTVSGPEGGYIYFDGTYMGVAPVTFDLVTGSHVISILADNEINSYTVYLAEGGDDVIYDFGD